MTQPGFVCLHCDSGQRSDGIFYVWDSGKILEVKEVFNLAQGVLFKWRSGGRRGLLRGNSFPKFIKENGIVVRRAEVLFHHTCFPDTCTLLKKCLVLSEGHLIHMCLKC